MPKNNEAEKATETKPAAAAGNPPAAPLPAAAPTPTPAPPPAPTPPPAAKAAEPKEITSVRVICEGPLGPKLLMKGAITDDPSYVAVLKVKGQKKVEAVR
jgi:hypothetical protein